MTESYVSQMAAHTDDTRIHFRRIANRISRIQHVPVVTWCAHRSQAIANV